MEDVFLLIEKWDDYRNKVTGLPTGLPFYFGK
jgi:hypothetical protein